MSLDAYEAGNFFSADQYVVNTPGCLLSDYGREIPHNQFHCGTLFHDAAMGLIWAESQVSLGAGETLRLKNALNNFYWN